MHVHYTWLALALSAGPIEPRSVTSVHRTAHPLSCAFQSLASSEEQAQRKKYKAMDHMPAGASTSVYASIFTSSSAPVKETYGARSIGARFI
jgi:hypothetical protein